MREIAIVGYGIVGKNMYKIFPEAVIIDPFQGYDDPGCNYRIAFICVPTPRGGSSKLNMDIVIDALGSVKAAVYCIKSTLNPGTIKNFDDNVIFSPEYYGETQDANNWNYDFIILGHNPNGRKYANIVADVYKAHSQSTLRIIFADSKTAELSKLVENAWLGYKVAFVNEIARIAQAFGCEPDDVLALWLNDPRVNRSHTKIFVSQPFWDSKCLNKDIPALIACAQDVGYNPEILAAMVAQNNKWMNEAKNDDGDC